MGKAKKKDEQKPQRTPQEDRYNKMREFLQHLVSYVIVISGLALINFFTSGIGGYWWFLWPAFGWGIGLMFHAAEVFVMSDGGLSGKVASRLVGYSPGKIGTTADEANDDVIASRPPASDVSQIVARGQALVDDMRNQARAIPKVEVRREVLDICSQNERILLSIEEHPEELALARDFLSRILEPSSKLIRDYSRLASRNIPSARVTLEQVEVEDLPALHRKLNDVHDRMHRGTLIDLEVARELMALDQPDGLNAQRTVAP